MAGHEYAQTEGVVTNAEPTSVAGSPAREPVQVRAPEQVRFRVESCREVVGVLAMHSRLLNGLLELCCAEAERSANKGARLPELTQAAVKVQRAAARCLEAILAVEAEAAALEATGRVAAAAARQLGYAQGARKAPATLQQVARVIVGDSHAS